jgi:hypothetical protein
VGADIASLQRLLKDWMAKNQMATDKVGRIIGFGYDDLQLKEQCHPDPRRSRSRVHHAAGRESAPVGASGGDEQQSAGNRWLLRCQQEPDRWRQRDQGAEAGRSAVRLR